MAYSSLFAAGRSVALAPRVTITVCGQGCPHAAYRGAEGVEDFLEIYPFSTFTPRFAGLT